MRLAFPSADAGRWLERRIRRSVGESDNSSHHLLELFAALIDKGFALRIGFVSIHCLLLVLRGTSYLRRPAVLFLELENDTGGVAHVVLRTVAELGAQVVELTEADIEQL